MLTGRSIDVVGAALPYVPLIEALRPLRGTPALDGLPELARLLPGAPPPPAAAGADGESQLRLFGSVLAVLERLSAGGPVVLVLEDLQWADGSTLDLVAFLAHAIQDAPILLLATWRREAAQPEAGVHRLVAGLRRGGAAVTVELGPLGRDDLGALLARAAGAPVPAEWPRPSAPAPRATPSSPGSCSPRPCAATETTPGLLSDVLLADSAASAPPRRRSSAWPPRRAGR